jgi:hypothetical protein
MESGFKIEDFFPFYIKENGVNYYNIEGDQVYNSVPLKKEFDTMRPYEGEKKPKPGEYLRHQEFMSRYMSPYTPYDRMLIFHGLGTGKTAVIAAVSEFAKKVKAGEISNNRIIILVRNPTLRKNIINEIATVLTNYKYYPTKEEMEDEGLSEDAINRRILKKIGISYDIRTFTTFVNEIKLLSNSEIKAIYSNRYILIDEAHNIKVQKQKGKDDISASNYNEIYRFLHSIVGSKVMLLTATPMRDQPSEICQILNLILPENKKLDRKNFEKEYFLKVGKQTLNLKEEKKNELKQSIKGMISYLRPSAGTVTINYAGDVDTSRGMIFNKTVRLEMEDYQSQAYTKAFKEDTNSGNKEITDEFEVDEDLLIEGGEGGDGIWKYSIQSSLFVYPDGTYGNKKVKKDENIWLKNDKNIWYATEKLKNEMQIYGKSQKDMLKRLKELSIKYYYVIKDIIENPDQKFFIYSNVVTGSGALLIGALLDLFGLTHSPIPTKKKDDKEKLFKLAEKRNSTEETIIEDEPDKPGSDMISNMEKKDRYVVLTGLTLSASQYDILINKVFNDKRNVYGDYLRVIVGSHIVGEGVSFKHIRKMYVLTPFWNNATTEQAIGRAIRSFSHDDLPLDKQNITVYRMAAEPQLNLEEDVEIESIDMMMYKVSEDKDKKIKQIERLLKEVAIDCVLNRERNVLKTDKPYSKECDYMSNCNYQCDYADSKYYDPNWVGDRIIDTYNLYYANSEINKIKDIILEIYMLKYAYDFEEIYDIVTKQINDISPIVLSRALNEIISYNIPIKNKLGFENYLREDRNLFFLIDDPFSPSSFTSWYYAANPEPDIFFDNFNQVLQYYENEKIGFVIESLISNKDNVLLIERIFKNISSYMMLTIVEEFTQDYYNQRIGATSFLMKYILNKFIKERDSNKYIKLFIKNEEKEIKILEVEDGEYVWRDLKQEDIKIIEKKKEEKKEEIKQTNWGYFGNTISKHSGKDEYKNLRISVVRRSQMTKEGKIDKRYIREGLSCGTGKLSTKGLLPLYYNLLKRARDNFSDPPTFNSKEQFTTSKIISNKNFKKYLEDVVYNDVINKKIMEQLEEARQFEDSEEDFLKWATKIFRKIYDLTEIDDKKELKSVISENMTFDQILDFIDIAESKKSKQLMIENILNDKDGEEYINKTREDYVFNSINDLDNEEKNILGDYLGRSAAELCTKLREWFEENNLIL